MNKSIKAFGEGEDCPFIAKNITTEDMKIFVSLCKYKLESGKEIKYIEFYESMKKRAIEYIGGN